MIRSAGGWSSVKELRRASERVKSDERILGDGDFVESVLKTAREGLERRYALEADGCDMGWLVGRVARVLELSPEEVLAPGKYARIVRARRLLCFWGVRELGMTTVALGKRLNLAQPIISQAVQRGQKIARDLGLRFRINNQ